MNDGRFILEDIMTMEEQGKSFRAVLYEEKKMSNGKVVFNRIAGNSSTIGGTQELGVHLAGPRHTAGPGSSEVVIDKLDQDPLIGSLAPVIGDELFNGAPIKELFGVAFGTDGCGPGTSDIYPVKRHGRNFNFVQDTTLGHTIPHIMVDDAHDDVETNMSKYEMRSVKDGFNKYYVKRPEEVSIKNFTKSGVEIIGNPDNLASNEGVVTKISMKIVLSAEDFADYFALVEGDINKRRFSAISILYGKAVDVNIDVDGTPMTFNEHREVIVTNRFNVYRPLGKYGDGTYVINIYLK